MSHLQREVARPLLRQLSGFKGYPRGEGESRFIDALCEISLSVEHAIAIVESFDAEFPTIREMRDTALNLRPKYEPKVNEREKWEREYGKPDTGFSSRILDSAMGATSMDPESRRRHHVEERRGMLWQAIRDSLYYSEGPGSGRPSDFWQKAADDHKRNHPQEVTAFRAQLSQSGWDTLMAIDWTKAIHNAPIRRTQSVAPVLAHPITQSDIDAELRAQRREPGDGE